MIAHGDLSQIHGSIEIGSDYGMFTMKQHAESLASQGIINERDYMKYFTSSEHIHRRSRTEDMTDESDE